VSIDWHKAPKGSASGAITLSGPDAGSVEIKVVVLNPTQPAKGELQGFVEADGYVSIEAAHNTNKLDTAAAKWEEVADYGRTLSAMTIFPVTAPSIATWQNAPSLEYRMYLFTAGEIDVEAILVPDFEFRPRPRSQLCNCVRRSTAANCRCARP
jgi:hypothetical protein